MAKDIYQQGEQHVLREIAQATSDDARIASLEQELGIGQPTELPPTPEAEAARIVREVGKSPDFGAPSVDNPAGLQSDKGPQPTANELEARVKGVTSSAVAGIAAAAQDTWNFLNAVDDLASSAFKQAVIGGESGVLGKATFANKIPLSEDPADKAAYMVARYVAPFAMGGALTGTALRSASGVQKFMGAALTNTSISAVAMDPNQERLSNVINEYPWLRNPISQFLASDPSDSEAEGRMKNAAEALLLDVGLGAVFKFGIGMSRGSRNVKAAVEGTMAPAQGADAIQDLALARESEAYIKSTKASLGDEATVTLKKADPIIIGGTADAATQQKIEALAKARERADAIKNPQARETALRQIEARAQGLVAPESVSADAADKLATTLASAEKPRINLATVTGSTNKLTQDAASEVVAKLTDKIVSAKGGTQTWSELDQLGLEYMNSNPEDFALLIRDHAPGTPYTNQQFAAIKLFAQGTMDEFIEVSTKAAALKSKDPALYTEADKLLLTQRQELEDMTGTIVPVLMGAVEIPGQQLNYLRSELPALGKGAKGIKQANEMIRLSGGLESNMTRAAQVEKIVERIGQGPASFGLSTMLTRTAGNMEKAASEVMLSGMVSGPQTSVSAATSGLLQNAFTEMQRANLALFGPAMGLNSKQWAGARAQFAARMAGMFQSGWEAFGAARETMRTGKSPLSGYNFLAKEYDEVLRTENLQNGSFLARSYAFAAANAKKGLDVIVDYSTRTLRAADSLNAAYARRQSYIEDVALENYTNGITGDAAVANSYARTLYPSKDMIEKADKMGREAAMNASYSDILGDGRAGKFFSSIDSALSAPTPLGKALVPFMKTRVNEIVQAMESTPIIGNFSPRVMDAFNAGGEQRASAIAKMAVGMEVVGGLMYTAHMNGWEFSGSEPADLELMRATKQRDPGWQPHSVKIGGNWYAYDRLGPVGKMLDMVSAYKEFSVYAEEGENVRYMSALVGTMFEFLTPQQLMEDVPGLLTDIAKMAKEGKEKDIAKFFAEQTAKMVPLSGALRWARNRVDPLAREVRDQEDPANSFVNHLKNMTPGFSNSMPAQRNIFGEVIQNPQYLGSEAFSPFMTSNAESDPVNRELQRLGMWNSKFVAPEAGDISLNVEMPPRSLIYTMPSQLGGGAVSVDLSPVEYDMFVQFSAGLRLPRGGFDSEAAMAAGFDAREYQQFLDRTTQAGGIPSLKDALLQSFANREETLARAGKADAPLNVQDNYMRFEVKNILSEYRKIGRAAMYASKKYQLTVRQGYMDRARALGAKETN